MTEPRVRGTRITDRQRRDVIRLYTRKGDPRSMRQISEELGLSFGSVHRVLWAWADAGGGTIRRPGHRVHPKLPG